MAWVPEWAQVLATVSVSALASVSVDAESEASAVVLVTGSVLWCT